MLSYFGCDQSQVQRYLSGRSLTESRLSLLFNAFLKVPMQFLILLTGVLVFVFYHFQRDRRCCGTGWSSRGSSSRRRPRPWPRCGPSRGGAPPSARAAAAAFARGAPRGGDAGPAREAYVAAAAPARDAAAGGGAAARGRGRGRAGTTTPTTSSRPTSCSQLRGGLAGLVIAVIFAAAMSTLSGEFNSLATATMVDFYKRFVPRGRRAAHDLLVSRLFTAFWGVFAAVDRAPGGPLGSAIEVVNRFGSYFYGSILGVFGLAVLTPRASARGAFYGLFAGMATVFLVSRLTTVPFLWYNVVGAVTVFVGGARDHRGGAAAGRRAVGAANRPPASPSAGAQV